MEILGLHEVWRGFRDAERGFGARLCRLPAAREGVMVATLVRKREGGFLEGLQATSRTGDRPDLHQVFKCNLERNQVD